MTSTWPRNYHAAFNYKKIHSFIDACKYYLHPPTGLKYILKGYYLFTNNMSYPKIISII